VARYFDVHPVDPQPRAIGQVVELLRDDGLVAYPTDSGYALGIRLGNRNDLTSKARESLISMGRMLAFMSVITDTKSSKEMKNHIKVMTRDVQSLADHTTFLSNTITFLLDAVLGVVNIEQSRIIKIFSVVAVVFLPPTLVASIYGMNFHYLPELGWSFGYPMSLGLMVISAVLPYLYFKWRGWM